MIYLNILFSNAFLSIVVGIVITELMGVTNFEGVYGLSVFIIVKIYYLTSSPIYLLTAYIKREKEIIKTINKYLLPINLIMLFVILIVLNKMMS